MSFIGAKAAPRTSLCFQRISGRSWLQSPELFSLYLQNLLCKGRWETARNRTQIVMVCGPNDINYQTQEALRGEGPCKLQRPELKDLMNCTLFTCYRFFWCVNTHIIYICIYRYIDIYFLRARLVDPMLKQPNGFAGRRALRFQEYGGSQRKFIKAGIRHLGV